MNHSDELGTRMRRAFNPEFARIEDARTTESQRNLENKWMLDRGISERHVKARRWEEVRVADPESPSNVLWGSLTCADVISEVENVEGARVRLLRLPVCLPLETNCMFEQLNIESFLELITRSFESEILSVHMDPRLPQDSEFFEHITWVSPTQLPGPELGSFRAGLGDILLLVSRGERPREPLPTFEYTLCHLREVV